MSVLLWLIPLVPLLGAAWCANRETDLRRSRRWGITGAAVALAATLLAFGGDLAGWRDGGVMTGVPVWGGLPAYVCLIGLIAVGLSPIRCLRPGTVGHLLQVTALSMMAVAVGDPLAMVCLSAVTMIPVWLELSAHGETRGNARVFGWYMIPSAVLMIVGAVLYQMNLTVPAVTMLVLGVAVRAALVPFHSWLADLAEHAPMGMVVVFVSPQLGVYALLRLLGLGISPQTAWLLAVAGAVTAVYAAALGAGKSRTRRALAYLIMSLGGLSALGLAHIGTMAWAGTLVMALVAGLSSAGFAMAVAALEARRGTLTLDRPTGSFARIPRLATAYLILGMACVGLPGTLGFVAEDLVIQGTLDGVPLLGLALLVAAACNGITVVKSFFMLFTGTARHHGEQDLTPREAWVFSIVLGLLVVLGLFPGPLVQSVAGEYEAGGAFHGAALHGVALNAPGPGG